MNFKLLRKIYPHIEAQNKNICWRRITDDELLKIAGEPQKLCNCFSMSTRDALINSSRGREILKKRIWVDKNATTDSPAYKIILSPNGRDEVYRVSPLDYYTKYAGITATYNEIPKGSGNYKHSESNNLNTAIDIAITKMISKHPKEKPWYVRLFTSPISKKCEFNHPSKAFEWFTGIKPVAIGEDGLFNNLNKNKQETLKQLDELSGTDSKNYSFILLTGFRTDKRLENWHCYPIKRIGYSSLDILNKRTDDGLRFTGAEVTKLFKALVGIDWRKVEK
ncbi:MAG: hypothetical protein E7Z89_06260 [Cyanobacteria bacterium SIG28]|nr:hypothetical protein [Cyanobacteria bacterium SIG28]